MQIPDESNHYDYALTLRTALRPILASEGPPQNNTHPTVRYLIARSGGPGLRLDALARVPPGYGTPAFFAALNKDAPAVDTTRFRDGPISPAPYLMKVYPLGYYALDALAIAAGERIAGDGIVQQYFAARLFSVLCFSVALTCSWLLFMELRVPGRLALVLLAFTGFLPMALQTFGSVQPDNLVSALIAGILWLSLVALHRKLPPWALLAISVLLALLCATKRHYWVAVSLPVAAAFLLAAGSPRRRGLRVALLLVPSAAAYFATQPYLHWNGLGLTLCGSDLPPTRLNIWGGIADFAASALLGGQSEQRFWIPLGSTNQSIIVGNQQITSLMMVGLIAGTGLVVAMLLVALGRNLRRLARVARERSAGTAVRLASRNPALNAYFVYAIILLGAIVSFGGDIGLQGRYWLPFLPVIWYAAIVLAPTALSGGWERSTRRLLIGGVGTAILAIDIFAPLSIQHRYFKEAEDRNARAAEEIFASFESDGLRTPEIHVTVGSAYRSITLRGIATDLRSASPVTSVTLRFEGGPVITATPLAVPRLACNNALLSLLQSGFIAVIPTAKMPGGRHEASVWVETPWSRVPIRTIARATIDVTGK
jgi:hypothetical protein